MKNIGIKNIIMGIFVVAAVAAFMIFSGVINIGSEDQSAVGDITIWGSLPTQILQPYIEQAKEQNLMISYYQKNRDNYEDELINAFASGNGPDLFIMPHESILRHSDKVFKIPYTSFPRSIYERTYIDQAHLFLSDSGVIAFPIMVDPMVMYYNKALISSAFLLDVPEYWEDLSDFTNLITVQSGIGEVSISGAGLGTFDNIRGAKDILTTMILQNGNDIVGVDTLSKKKKSVMSVSEEDLAKTEQAIDFYTSSSRFGSNTYSWNEALVDSQSKFIAGELALYFGKASEIESIRRKNPNLDFNIALFPQIKNSSKKITHGDMTGIAIGKQTQNIPAALLVASKIASLEISDGLAKDLLVAPARKDLLRNKPEDSFRTLVYNSAIIADAWVDSDPVATSTIFRTIIRNVNTGASTTRRAIERANADLNTILDRSINKTIPDLQ